MSWTTFLLACLIPAGRLLAGGESEAADYSTHAIRGQIGWLPEVLARRHGIKSVPESSQRVLALETDSGEIIPLVEDIRGRSFRRDPRLRGIDVELLVRQYDGSPFVQVIRIFALKDGHKFELDYWCEVCSIAMYELKPCDCCQGDIELRERRVESR